MIDSHCHLADEAFVADLAAVAARARAAGVEAAMCILSADEAPELARVEPVRAAWPEVRFAAAIHPHRAGAYAGRAADAAAVTGSAVDAANAVAVGEIGLDYHYDFAPKDVQRDVFAAQVNLAVERGLPVVIHTREATHDTIDVLREAGAGKVRGVMHCFSGSLAEARLALDLGFYISLSGILTFPKAGELRETARQLPIERLLVETDAPFLAPVPNRGKRNEPAWVRSTVETLAGIHGVAVAVMAAQVAANFRQLIGEAR